MSWVVHKNMKSNVFMSAVNAQVYGIVDLTVIA